MKALHTGSNPEIPVRKPLNIFRRIMPIYAYKCESCGHAKDVLQKMSDAPLTDCPQCGAATFKKQLTAAGFQLKGSGWYVTDFRGGAQPSAPAGQGGEPGAAAADSKSGDAAAATPAAAPAVSGASPAPAPVSPASSKTTSGTSSESGTPGTSSKGST